MNTIIALKGKANTGKTTTINLLPAIMVANGYHQVPGKYQRHGVDFLDIFENGTNLVGITSAGDTFHAVYDRLNELVTAGCDICICACRTYDRIQPGTIAAVKSFPGYTPDIVPKTIALNPSLELSYNTRDANKIFGMI